MERRLLLDVVVTKGSAILQLLASKDEALLIRRDALLVLNLCLHIVDGVRGLDLKGDGLACERLNEDLHVELIFCGCEFTERKKEISKSGED